MHVTIVPPASVKRGSVIRTILPTQIHTGFISGLSETFMKLEISPASSPSIAFSLTSKVTPITTS